MSSEVYKWCEGEGGMTGVGELTLFFLTSPSPDWWRDQLLWLRWCICHCLHLIVIWLLHIPPASPWLSGLSDLWDNFLKRKKINIPVFLTLRYCDIVLMASCNQLECKAMFRKRLVVPQSPRNQNISSSPHPSQFARFSCLCRWRQLLDFYCENEKCVEVERTEESSLPIVKFSPEQSLSVSFQFDVDFYPSLAWLGEIKCRIKVGNLHLVRAEGGSLDPQLTTKQSLFPEQKDW